jgi:hypothetical protein
MLVMSGESGKAFIPGTEGDDGVYELGVAHPHIDNIASTQISVHWGEDYLYCDLCSTHGLVYTDFANESLQRRARGIRKKRSILSIFFGGRQDLQ